MSREGHNSQLLSRAAGGELEDNTAHKYTTHSTSSILGG